MGRGNRRLWDYPTAGLKMQIRLSPGVMHTHSREDSNASKIKPIAGRPYSASFFDLRENL